MKYEIKNLNDLDKFAQKIAPLFENGDVISLVGDLGAGKTTLVQMIGKYLNIKDYITSPTFSIINIYEGEKQINHLDLYRLENPEELYQLDYESYFYPDGISFIEWAKMGGYLLPDDMIEIQIEVNEDMRTIEIKPDNKRAIEIGEKLNENFSS